MASSKRRKERREAERQARQQTAPVAVIEAIHASAAPALRLVRSEGERIPPKSDAAGLASAAIDPVSESGRSLEVREEPQIDGDVVSGAAAGNVGKPLTDAIPIGLVRRSFDAGEINPILNDPSVFRFAGVQGIPSLDVTPLLADERNILLMMGDGGIIFAWQALGVYEVHTNFLKDPESGLARGAAVLNNSRAAYRWMFTQTECVTLLTRIPAHNRGALRIAPLAGWTKEFYRKAVWPSVSDGIVDMSFYALRYDDWVRKTPELMFSGRAFHERLDAEFARHGVAVEQHPDEDCHDLHVGACLEMVYGHQLDKAVILYNRWAQFSGYAQIGIVSYEPIVLNIGNALIQIQDHTFKVVKVK